MEPIQHVEIPLLAANEERAVVLKLPKFDLSEMFFSRIPHEVEDEDKPNGRKHLPLAAQIGLCAAVGTAVVLFRDTPPFNLSLMELLGPVFKNATRTAELYVENYQEKVADFNKEQEQVEGIPLEPSALLKHYKWYKYGFLAIGTAFSYTTDSVLKVICNMDLSLTSFSLRLLSSLGDRDFTVYFKGQKVVDPKTNKKKKVPPPLWEKLRYGAENSAGALVTVASGGSPVLADGLYNGTTTAIKFIAKEKNVGWKTCWIAMGATTFLSVNVDYLKGCLADKKIINLSQFISNPNILTQSMALISLTCAQKNLLFWQVGSAAQEEEMDQEIALNDPDYVPPAPKILQLGVLVTFLAAAFFTLHFTQNRNNNPEQTAEPDSFVGRIAKHTITMLLSNRLLSISGRMSTNLLRQLPGKKWTTPLMGTALLATYGASYGFQEQMPVEFLTVTLIIATMAPHFFQTAFKIAQLGKKAEIPSPNRGKRVKDHSPSLIP